MGPLFLKPTSEIRSKLYFQLSSIYDEEADFSFTFMIQKKKRLLETNTCMDVPDVSGFQGKY